SHGGSELAPAVPTARSADRTKRTITTWDAGDEAQSAKPSGDRTGRPAEGKTDRGSPPSQVDRVTEIAERRSPNGDH
ncbi:hypothetical protein JG687_00005813, partial [Phytophthora cactorum]